MKNLKKIQILIFIILNLIFLINSQVLACSCIIPESPSISMGKSTSVFIGRVSNIKESTGVNELLGSIKSKKISFKVSTVIKGENEDEIIIKTADNSASCGYSFEEGAEYIVYTYGEKNNLEVSLCSRTALTKNAQEDLREFDDIIWKTSTGSDISENNNNNNNLNDIVKNKSINSTYLIIAIIAIIIIFYMKIKYPQKSKKD